MNGGTEDKQNTKRRYDRKRTMKGDWRINKIEDSTNSLRTSGRPPNLGTNTLRKVKGTERMARVLAGSSESPVGAVPRRRGEESRVALGSGFRSSGRGVERRWVHAHQGEVGGCDFFRGAVRREGEVRREESGFLCVQYRPFYLLVTTTISLTKRSIYVVKGRTDA